MPWNESDRLTHKRSDDSMQYVLNDAELEAMELLTPKQGRMEPPRVTCMREVMNALNHMDSSGCQWRALDDRFPLVSTVRHCFHKWQRLGVMDGFLHKLRRLARIAAGRAPEPTAAIIRQPEREDDEKWWSARL